VSKHRGPARRGRRWFGLLFAVLLIGAAAVTGPTVIRKAGFDVSLPWSGSAPTSCTPVQVQISVVPELSNAVESLLGHLQGSRQADGSCVQVVVTSEAATETIRKTQVLPADRAPQLWIPDSSLWERQIQNWPLTAEGSIASSPLVVATSEAVVAELGWAAHPPTWGQALSGVRPVAMPDLQNNASGVLSILGLWQSLGKTSTADQAVAAAVLASTRSTAPTPTSVVEAAVRNDPATPLLVTSELSVFAANRGNASSRLVAVYPQNGSPALDYPILRVSPASQGIARTMAVDSVIAALKGTSARDLVRRSGLRDATGGGPGGAGLSANTVTTLDIPAPAEVNAFLTKLQALTKPSHLTVVIDVSLSMQSLIGGGLTRAQLAGQAAQAAGNLLSDKSSVGLWVFSRDLAGSPVGTDYRQLDKLLPLGQPEAGHTHRDVIDLHLLSLNNMLGGDGTALYSTALAAMKSATQEYDDASVNSVVLFTDGVNDDAGGISLAQLTAQLKALADPQKPVRLIAIGIGPDADLDVLRTMAAPSAGAAYVATNPDQLKTILFDALAHRTPTS
jgi:Ca-activated chloride channel homolog